MNQFVLQQGKATVLRLFPHIAELGTRKNSSIQINSFSKSKSDAFRVFYIIDGKFDWIINGNNCSLYPGDTVFILPHQELYSENDLLAIGSFSWINIEMEKFSSDEIITGKWSAFSRTESMAIGNTLWFHRISNIIRFQEASKIFKCLETELLGEQIGFQARVNHQLDELLIQIARQLNSQNNSGRDFPKTFMILEQSLRQNLSHPWTVEEMASLVGLGTTLFNERVKAYSGFSPLNYLINIRISEAIKLLKKAGCSVTDIALDTGFYSSQHFATTFKKLTGFTPSEYKKNHLASDSP
ncbi:MAG: AraC family transcriptional regulator [Bacteroidota bacterium]